MSMTKSLLDIKFYALRPRGVLARPHLTERLDQGALSKLTLISAPAGFGKTTLVAEWLAHRTPANRSVGWLSVDEADDEPVTFWTYVISALQRAVPGVGADALSLLHAPQAPALPDILATVLNELGAVPHDVVLVLDDYQAVGAPEIHAGMTYLLEHLPAHVHLVLATRADPPLPLSRLRARGELVELRAADPEAGGGGDEDQLCAGAALQSFLQPLSRDKRPVRARGEELRIDERAGHTSL